MDARSEAAAALLDATHVFEHSRSYRLFLHTATSQLQEILKWSLVGLHEGKKQPERILGKIDRAVKGLAPLEEEDTEPKYTIRLNYDQVELLTLVLTRAKEKHDRLSFYLHSVLLIALWSSFEAYLQGVIAEFFVSNNLELASDKQFSARELLENSRSVIDHLIEREITDFGHFSLDGMAKYVKSRLKYDFHSEEMSLLQGLYFLRNIAAHNSGFIRTSQRNVLPTGVAVYQDQIEIPKAYLDDAITRTVALVRRMDRHLVDNRNVPKCKDALFEDVPDVNTS
jgi:hypothetical protein